MVQKTGVLLIVIFLLTISIVFADVDYTEVGERDGFFIRGNGLFNENLDPSDTFISTVVLSDPEKVPLVFDLDGDGIQEILVINDENIIVFQNKTLSISATVALNATSSDTFSNMIIFDIDGDGVDEIIIASEIRESLHILNFSDGQLNIENQISMNELTYGGGQITLGCESANRCLVTYAESSTSAGITDLSVSYFNSTFIGNELTLAVTTGFQAFCTPKIRRMAITNYDSQIDTDIEFIVSHARPDQTTGDTGINYFVHYLNVESDNTITLEGTSTVDGTDTDEIISGVPIRCDGIGNSFTKSGGSGTALPGKLLSAPMTYDADPTNAGEETLLALMIDNNEFVIRMFKSDFSKIRDFPLIQESEGQIIGNLFRAEIFDDSTSETDFCVLAQEVTNFNHLALTCGSLTDTNGVGIFNTQSIEFRAENLNLLNVTDDFNHWGILAHAVEYDDSNSVSEVVSTWGVFEPEFSGILCTFGIDAVDCNLNQLFNVPASVVDGTILPVDLDNNNLEDFLILTQTNLFYLDDGFQNEGVNEFCGEPGSVQGTCTQIFTNPCLESVWKLNTSVEITITPIDPEGDLIQVSATLYDGDSNEITQTSGNVSSGTTVPFSFQANKTIGAGTLTLTAVDIVENPLDIKTVTKTFSVGPNGVEFNDCTTLIDSGVLGVPEEEEPVDLILTTETGNAIETGFLTIAGFTGVSVFIMWIIFMAIVAVGIFNGVTIFNKDRASEETSSKLAVVLIAEILMLIVGTLLGFIPLGIVITIVVIGLIAVGLFFSRMFTGTRT